MPPWSIARGAHIACALLLAGRLVPAQVRVASLNLDKHFGPAIVSQIRQTQELRKADILLLQELVDGPTSHMPEDIAAALGLHVIFAPAFQLNPQFQEGLAILSRYPITEKTVIPLPHNNLHFRTRIRIALAVTVQLPGGKLRIINTHLDDRVNSSEKRKQLEEIWPTADDTRTPCIIGGDFNSGNFRWLSHTIPLPGIQSLRGMIDQQMRAHGFVTTLGPGKGTLHFLGLKLDWIYSRGLVAGNSGVTLIKFSDHNSVWVSFLAS